MRYSAGISDAEYGALEDGYEQGRRNADPALQRENNALRFQLDQRQKLIRELKQRILELENSEPGDS
jgi:hypothetical protein